jgi:hypothetical protein
LGNFPTVTFVGFLMALTPNAVPVNPSVAQDDGVSFSANRRSVLQAELAHVPIDSRFQIKVSPEHIDELRQAGVCNFDKLPHDLVSVTFQCVDHGLFNKGEAGELNQIAGNEHLSPEQRAAALSKLLYRVLARHIAMLEAQEQADAPRAPVRSRLYANSDTNDNGPRKFHDECDDSGYHTPKAPGSERDGEKKDDPNAQYLSLMYERLLQLEEKHKKREARREQDLARAKLLNLKIESYPNRELALDSPIEDKDI